MRNLQLSLLAIGALPISVVLSGALSVSVIPPRPKFNIHNGKPLQLVWSDEFDYAGKPDPAKWGYHVGGGGWGNDELENYTDRLDNARVENGHLVIEAKKENFDGSTFTSARLISAGAGWKYGHFEMRAKLPRGAGTWPAVWMLASHRKYGEAVWPDNGEIDILEHVGRDPQNILGCFYGKNFIWYLNNGKSETRSVPNAETGFHVYALDWDEDAISLSVDGIIYNNFPNPHTGWKDWPFDQNFAFIINLAVGGGFAGEVDESVFPQQLMIDYIRVYQQTDS